MAIIECPKCRERISDRARKCVHCGTVFLSVKKQLCTECGAELEEGAAMCFRCGCPTEANDSEIMSDDFRQMGVSGSQKVKGGMRWIVAAAVVLGIAFMGIAIGILMYQEKKAEEENARRIQEYEDNLKKAEEENARLIQEYEDNLRLVTDTMLSGAVDAENCCNLIVQVWNNAIWEKKDDATDRYTRPDGYFVEDFNDALENLFTDSEFCSQIDLIMENQRAVNKIVGKLKNPPEEYRAAYEALSECYNAYLTFTNMAINPTGSLNTFSEDFDEADTEFVHCYQKMEFYLQD